ncbi:MAG: sigma-70 family RNA polymerase sigma factor [Betaproteobacteria bacterium]|nr:sigma-70 family RNA polymerase sigma factor [Betaproteobacteria bacterium]
MFEGGKSRFERVVRAFSTELYRYAYWLCRDRFVAEDLVQETFARAWQAWEKLQDENAVKAWLYSILRNEHARLFERKRLDRDDEQDLGEIPDTVSSNPHASLEIREAIHSLPQSYREPLLLQVLGGFSCSEIAGLMGISEGAVMTRLSRARLAFRQLPGWDVMTRKKAS